MPAAKPTKSAPKAQKPKRLGRGFAQTGGILGSQIRKASESRGFSETRLLTHWAEIAGEAVAKIAQPVKVGYGRRGLGATLTLLCSGANAPMVQMQLPAIRERVNATYGYAAISRIHITQTAPTGFGESATPFSGAPTPEKPKPRPISALDQQALASNLSDVADHGLKDALEALGKNILSKPR